jgi:phosphoglycolate phosphatase
LLGVTRERTLMIGDTTHDLQMAVNAGVPAVGLSYGAHPREELERLAPLACVGSFAELMQWLKQDA